MHTAHSHSNGGDLFGMTTQLIDTHQLLLLCNKDEKVAPVLASCYSRRGKVVVTDIRPFMDPGVNVSGFEHTCILSHR